MYQDLDCKNKGEIHMAVIYTEPQFHGKRPGGHGYEYYTREVYCICGKKIGTQVNYDGWDKFCYDNKEKSEYKFCPYCGTEINGGNR